MAASRLRVAPRQRDVDVADLVDLKAFADRLHAAERLEQGAHAIAGEAEDLEVFGLAGDRVRALLEAFGRVEAVGESFQVYKIGDIDVSLPRRDSKAGRGHRGFVVTGDPDMSIAEAARRRDFTINALSWDPLSGEYFDPCDGRADLERRLLRVVDPQTFGDDSLRVLRGVQFAARFALTLEETTAALCRQIPLDDLPPERVW